MFLPYPRVHTSSLFLTAGYVPSGVQEVDWQGRCVRVPRVCGIDDVNLGNYLNKTVAATIIKFCFFHHRPCFEAAFQMLLCVLYAFLSMGSILLSRTYVPR